ncbi:fibrinogen-like protein 1 [Plakobranchus ocellatus]|uniref:Fibrinogen-like protein 1 n=1 Tax=Plakobranchus ocellatus TaxID=259542 RepID=A0AAV3YQU2_9GAST|nr:fibrinogen-like protein 1 [Plakobranchus ocellatus]
MAALIWCAFSCYLLLGCQGLKLTLDLNSQAVLNIRPIYGVLTCEENYVPSQFGSNSRVSQDNVTVTSLEIFKTDPSDQKNNALVSVTIQEPRLARVSNGIKAEGHLEDQGATLRLELFKQEDSQHDFTCQARAVSPEGHELLSTSHLLQQPRQNNVPASATDVISTQQEGTRTLALIQQLDFKLGLWGSSMDKLELELQRLKDFMDRDTESLRADLDAKSDRVEDKIQSLGRDFVAQHDRLEDKMETVQKELNEKIDRFENNMETFNIRAGARLETLETTMKDKVDGKSDSCVNERHDNVQSDLKTEMQSFRATLSTIKTHVGEIDAKVKSCVNDNLDEISERFQLALANQTRAVQNISCKNSEEIIGSLNNRFDALENSLQEKHEELSFNINASALETQSLGGGFALRDSSSKDLKSAIEDVLLPKNCFKGMLPVVASNPYIMISPGQNNTLDFPILCDAVTDEGGWIVIQHRSKGDVSFYRGWEEYKNGFGSMDGDFWLGNDKIHSLTSTGTFELRVDLRYNGNSVYAHYNSFSVGDEKSNYLLHVAHYDGNAGDSLIVQHNGMPFSTHDRDNDNHATNCAVVYVGAWWYNACHKSNLNGMWNGEDYRGPRWDTLSVGNAVSYTEMKIRRVISILN